MTLPKLVVVLGTTACGKSGLGVELALRFGGEIVSADSRQVYRGLDLGTGKITPAEMKGIPHHMLDVDVFPHRRAIHPSHCVQHLTHLFGEG